MALYEKLLSKDPLGAFEKIKEDYIRYYKHAYRVSDNYVDKDRIEKLSVDDNLYKEPYLELLPEYDSDSNRNINSVSDLANDYEDFFGSKDNANDFFVFIKKGLMDYPPYGHQIGMLEKAIKGVDGIHNTVITSGTGSGKTESFLLPLFAQIYKEALSQWNDNTDKLHTDWFCANNMYSPIQRIDEERPAALRALVLYPMNALVEDQVRRLRKALDSDKVREHFDSKLKKHRIFYGRYNSSTIGQKNVSLLETFAKDKGITAKEKLAKDLAKASDRYKKIMEYYNNLSDDDKKAQDDAPFIGPRLSNDTITSEMVTRWDMQVTPPDIMITNVSMLSVMLMRSAEADIFQKTRDWLASEEDKDNPTRIFHLIIDELHLYRGTSGSETACLVRMLLDAIGLAPVVDDGNGGVKPNPQLRILASSASLGDTKPKEGEVKSQTEKYLEEFFGIYSSDGKNVFNIQEGTNFEADLNGAKIENYGVFSQITPSFIEEENQVEVLSKFISNNFDGISTKEFIEKYQSSIFLDFERVLKKNPNKSTTSASISELIETKNNSLGFFPNMDSLRGFFIFRAFVDRLNASGYAIAQPDEKKLSHRLPRLRFHQFYKYIEGLWGELQATIDANGHKICDQEGKNISPIANVSYIANEVSNNHKVLELLRCEACGEMYIGGSRLVDEDGRLTLTLNYPELDKIPNFNPTPMVQNKSYKEYAIFWPTHSKEDVYLSSKDEDDAKDHVASLETGNASYEFTGAKAKWENAYLDIVTGKIGTKRIEGRPLIEGKLFELERTNNNYNEEDIQALPCCCPKCRIDYRWRKYTKSPIRNFRTGIDRSNQILSKELMYQLSGKSPKLIGFSDSRDDAAKQAYGIENEHYRDMVRMLFVDCVQEKLEEENKTAVLERQVYNFIINNKEKYEKFSYLICDAKELYPGIDARIEEIKKCVENNEQFQMSPIKDYVILDDFRYRTEELYDGRLTTKLIKTGINPAGVNYEDQFWDSKYTLHWSDRFDFTTGTYKSTPPGQIILTRDSFRATIYSKLESAVFANSFGRYMGVSVVDSGIGYLCSKRDDSIKNSQEYDELNGILSRLGYNTFDFVDAFIRIMGDNYRYNDPDSDKSPNGVEKYEDLGKNRFKFYILKFARYNNLDEQRATDLGIKLFAFIIKHVAPQFILYLELLAFRMMQPEDKYYECPKCHRIHPNYGMGLCTRCGAQLTEPNEEQKVQKLRNEHYISFDILTERRNPRRLHTEELTGQTDNIQDRLLEFKGFILDGNDLAKTIDMVNVTTTMEVGVDIGSLEAVFQGNMPPTRYNYQQRVGRGGRRGQAFSTAFTFCRGRSHDVYYYTKATDAIVGSEPAVPTLTLAPYDDIDNGKPVKRMKQSIMKRVIVKSILRKALDGLFDINLSDTAGEMGKVSEWNNNKEKVENWIKSNNIESIVKFYFGQFNENDQIAKDIEDITKWIGEDLVNKITKITQDYTNKETGLAQCLAESGLLPMYGLPSDVRDFYHGFDNGKGAIRKIGRSLEMSLTEFAPGSEKMKDKGKYMVAGITAPIVVRDDNLEFYEKDVDALSERYVVEFDHNINTSSLQFNITNIDENCDRTISASKLNDTLAQNGVGNKVIVVSPHAYRSYYIKNNFGRTIDNNDRRSAFSQASVFAKEDNSQTTHEKIFGNVRIVAYGTDIKDHSYIWHINTNNNRFFYGKYQSLKYGPEGDNGTFIFCDSKGNNINSEGFKVALGCRKATEMVKIQILDYNKDRLDLQVKHDRKESAALRAAFLSAAYLIQRVLADKLDVAPEEIEISEKLVEHQSPIIYLSDALPNGAGIVSYLYQRDNMVQLLKSIVNFETEFMKSLLAEPHRKECLTSCQKCLKTFTNRGYHHVLDWRLGVGIINLMLNRDYDFGFDGSENSAYKELSSQPNILKACAEKLGIELESDKCFGTKIGSNVTILIANPLWNYSEYLKKHIMTSNRVEVYSIFKLLRSVIEKEEDYDETVNTENTENTNQTTDNFNSNKINILAVCNNAKKKY